MNVLKRYSSSHFAAAASNFVKSIFACLLVPWPVNLMSMCE